MTTLITSRLEAENLELKRENKELLERLDWLQRHRISVNDQVLLPLANAISSLQTRVALAQDGDATLERLTRHVSEAFTDLQKKLLETRRIS